MSGYKVNQTLVEALESRQKKVKRALSYVQNTKDLFDRSGSQELKSTYSRFDNIIKGLQASQVRLVVIGEFSHGKSSLVNALLDIKLLPTALEATTAINTFIHPLPEGETEPYLEIHFKYDTKTPERIVWDNDNILQKWGTELDVMNKDLRAEVSRIHGYTNHHLLDKGVILIDTPGLQAVHKHHMDITIEAIDQAHIAIWVQSAEALGGRLTEWEFLRSTITKNFSKFITVVNKWDLIIEAQDEQEKQKTLKTREREKLEIVRRNFREQLPEATSEERAILTSNDNLLGVSAAWANDNDPERRRLSRIDTLAERIAELCTGEEAQEEIIRKPLQALTAIQGTLKEYMDDMIRQFMSSQDLNERKRGLEQLDADIKILELELQRTTAEARMDHSNAAIHHAKGIQRELVAPLQQMKAVMEQYVSKSYVKKQIEKNNVSGTEKTIGLPAAVQDEFETVNKNVTQQWGQQKRSLEKALTDLRVEYQESMRQKAKVVIASLDTMDIELPELKISVNVDLGDVMEYQKKMFELQERRKNYEKEAESLEQEILLHRASPERVALAKESIKRAEWEIQNLGPQPASEQRIVKRPTSSGGWYSSPSYENDTEYDDSNVKEYKKEKEALRKLREDKELACQKIIEDEEKKSGRRMNVERAMAKVEQEIKKLERELEKERQEAEAEKSQLIDQIFESFQKKTTGKLAEIISFIEDQTLSSVQKVFDDQLAMLNQCVEEQYIERLRAKRSQREEVQAAIEMGEAEVKRRLKELADCSESLRKLSEMTTAELYS